MLIWESWKKTLNRLASTCVWTPALGAARSILAVATAAAFLLTPSGDVVQSGSDLDAVCQQAVGKTTAICVGRGLGIRPGSMAVILAVVLLVVALGWRPRLTAIPHWYATVSLVVANASPDGGDRIAANLTLLLLPIVLTDPRTWHWSALRRDSAPTFSKLMASATLVAVQVQVAAIYLHAAIAKFGVEPWRDGTAMHYWLLHPTSSVPTVLRAPIDLLISSSIGVVAMTWIPLSIELLCGIALLFQVANRRRVFVAGVALHAGIALLLGLTSFACVMIGALILLLRTPDVVHGSESDAFRTEPHAVTSTDIKVAA